MEECEFVSSTRSQLSTHIRRSHLGAAVVCYVCDEAVVGGQYLARAYGKGPPLSQKGGLLR